MKKCNKVICLIISALMLSSVMFGCSTNTSVKDTKNSPKANDNKKETLTMFMGNSGLQFPDGVSESDNKFINIVKKYANVDLKVTVPSYNEFATKLNLLLSSGNIPDIVHTWIKTDIEKVADQGAFIDLRSYYNKSKVIQKYITPQMMDLAKSASGKNYRIPMAYDKGPQGWWLVVRNDIAKKYDGGTLPTTVDGWLTDLRAEKKAEPDSTPLKNRVCGTQGISYGGEVIYDMYGCPPFATRIQGGKTVPNIATPECKAATQLMRQLYSEGVLAKDFALGDTAQSKFKDTMVVSNSADQIVPAY